MKITFDLTYFEAQQLLRCCQIGHDITSLTNYPYPVASLTPVIHDLSEVLAEMAKRDPSIGHTTGIPRTKKVVYIEQREPSSRDIG